MTRLASLSQGAGHGVHGSLWQVTAAPDCRYVQLQDDVETHVLVIGAGFTGLSAALHLAEAGTAVRVLEARSVGSGAAGRSSGFVNAGLWASPSRIVDQLGESQGEWLLRHLGDAPRFVFDLIRLHRIECELQESGTLQCATGERQLRDLKTRFLNWRSRGADVSLLSASETASAVGSGAYSGALLDRRGGTLNPLSYARGLARAAKAAGAEVNVDSPVLHCEKAGEQWLARTPRGTVRANWVVVASDAYSEGAWLDLSREQVRLPYFNFATFPIEERMERAMLPPHLALTDTAAVMNAVRLDCSGRLILGSVGALRLGGAAVHYRWAKRFLARTFPKLGPLEFEFGWWGHIGLTSDHMPRFHRLAPRVLGIGGYNGRGIAAGTVFGKLVADHINRKPATAFPLDERPVIRAPFRRCRELAFELGSQLVHAAGSRWPVSNVRTFELAGEGTGRP